MITKIQPSRSEWRELCQRPTFELEYLDSSVRNILNRVRSAGDRALIDFARQFDHTEITALAVSPEEFDQAERQILDSLKESIEIAAKNIQQFHAAQKRPVTLMETMPGVTCWRKAVAIQRVGIYIPGGTAPLFSTVLMLAIPAQLAGCEEIVLCSPPSSNGNIHPAILFAARLAGVTKVFKSGGAQAIAAMAYGTDSIPAVDKIFGPGNQYVTKAKQLVSLEGTAIDLPAGPSEVMVIADDQADASFVAADLLSQAEHGKDSQVVLIASDESILRKVQKELESQLKELPRKQIAEACLENSLFITLPSIDDQIAFANAYAPEHLIINTQQADAIADRISNAGSVFIGSWSPESVGDYASGTNHTLPTNGFARAQGGVAFESFVKYITYQKLSKEGLQNIGPHVERMAAAEELEGHRQAVRVRLQQNAR